MSRGILYLAAAAAMLVGGAQGKYVVGRGYFGTGSVREITKCSFAPGTSTISGNITYRGAKKGSVYLFMDTNWKEKFHMEEDCNKVKHATTRIPIGHVGRVMNGIGVGNGLEPVYDEVLKKYNWHFTWEITHAVRTYGWYIVVGDCQGFVNGDEAPDESEDEVKVGTGSRRQLSKKNRYEYYVTLLNPGGNHLPADEHGLPTLYWTITILMIGYYLRSRSAFKKKSGHGLIVGSHAAIKAFAFAYIFQIMSMVFEIMHLWVYAGNGYGVFVFDFFSDSFEGISTLIISFALLCLANGWTLVDFSKRPGGKKPSVLQSFLNRPTLDDETPTLFILIIIVFISTILQVIHKVQADDFLTFHDYDGISGKFILIQRVLVGIMFFLSLTSTIRSDEVRGQIQMEGFLKRLLFFGTIWFFAFPSLVFIAGLFAHYLRHRVVTGGVLIIQSVCLTLMSQQFLSHSSWYAKVSEVASTGMLPGAFGGGGMARGK
eukprot:CAMPEP_0203799616 /NCGR_PEP_ID=MMETSP0100_2-20121128/10014_1 /ASSEMBLY_ACC=CAM_ASM_000210 /TAXON_ID=96639 /ORGANISM=" , Strain NY0313808BC1" /LENGTH=486 /DNA_ID=CAMNT_0050705515 /DNA_START=86 /DNA_END=1543 /DNA_ORIENTATION=-